MKKHILPTKQKFLSIALILCLVLLINHTQNTKLENKSYKLLSILNPCVELVLAADTVHDKDLLNDLSRVINLDIIYDNPTKSGTSLYWKYKIFNDNYTKEDYSTCLSAFIKLCLKYPAIVLQERTSLFIQATGMNDDFLSNAEYAIEFFDADNERTAAQNMISADWFANTPLFPNLRKTMLRALNLQSSNSYFSIRRLIWNALIPILILLYAWCKTIQKKNRDYFIITTAIIVKIPIVYLTQPTYWFMYWLSFYLIGYVIIVYGLLHFMTIYTDKNK